MDEGDARHHPERQRTDRADGDGVEGRRCGEQAGCKVCKAAKAEADDEPGITEMQNPEQRMTSRFPGSPREHSPSLQSGNANETEAGRRRV